MYPCCDYLFSRRKSAMYLKFGVSSPFDVTTAYSAQQTKDLFAAGDSWSLTDNNNITNLTIVHEHAAKRLACRGAASRDTPDRVANVEARAKARELNIDPKVAPPAQLLSAYCGHIRLARRRAVIAPASGGDGESSVLIKPSTKPMNNDRCFLAGTYLFQHVAPTYVNSNESRASRRLVTSMWRIIVHSSVYMVS